MIGVSMLEDPERNVLRRLNLLTFSARRPNPLPKRSRYSDDGQNTMSFQGAP